MKTETNLTFPYVLWSKSWIPILGDGHQSIHKSVFTHDACISTVGRMVINRLPCFDRITHIYIYIYIMQLLKTETHPNKWRFPKMQVPQIIQSSWMRILSPWNNHGDDWVSPVTSETPIHGSISPLYSCIYILYIHI